MLGIALRGLHGRISAHFVDLNFQARLPLPSIPADGAKRDHQRNDVITYICKMTQNVFEIY